MCKICRMETDIAVDTLELRDNSKMVRIPFFIRNNKCQQVKVSDFKRKGVHRTVLKTGLPGLHGIGPSTISMVIKKCRSYESSNLKKK